MTRRGAALLGLALPLALLAGAPSAVAHEVDPSVLTVIDSITPPVPGITVDVGTSVTTELLLDNTTAHPVEVLDDSGQPFLRIGPGGVEGNLAAPAWYLSNQPLGSGSAIPAGASTDAPDRWVVVSTEHAWGWFDHRLHPTPLAGVLGEGRRPTFEIPLRTNGRAVVVSGHLEPRTTVPRFAATLTATPDPASGLVVQLLDGRAPGLFVRYDGAGEAVVEGRDGEPFLRLRPNGAEVNEHSPTWLFTAQARGEDLAGVVADPTAAPAWRSVSGGPSYAWLDPRALIEEVGSEPVRLDWSVPVQVDGQTMEIVGRSTARLAPLAEVAGGTAADDEGGPGGALVLVVVLAAATVGLAVCLRVRGGLKGRG